LSADRQPQITQIIQQKILAITKKRSKLMSWAPIAIGEDGLQYLPLEAKQVKQRYHSPVNQEIELIPVAGEINTHHWRSINGESYQRLGYEMGEWHLEWQLHGRKQWGYLLEHRIDYDGGYYVADAYDPDTNTIIEYVDTHFDSDKINTYFELGYNQEWVFKSDCSRGYATVERYQYIDPLFLAEFTKDLEEPLDVPLLPSISVIHQPKLPKEYK
jgi:hypothetical protein